MKPDYEGIFVDAWPESDGATMLIETIDESGEFGRKIVRIVLPPKWVLNISEWVDMYDVKEG